ncbi:MAG: ABC transporter ATP-binding protein [Caldicoprobacterales bacterium]|jgi:ATP-binding cassette subfamily B protein
MLKKLRLLFGYMRGNRLLYAGAIICVGLSAVAAMIPTLIVRFTVDSLIGDQPAQLPRILLGLIDRIGGLEFLRKNLWVMGLCLIGVHLVNFLFVYLRGKWSATAAESTAKRLRDRLYGHLQRLTYDFHVKAETGDLIQRCTSDVETIRRFLAVQLVEVGRALSLLTASLIIMLSLDVRMTLISMIVIPFILAFSLIFFMKVQKAFLEVDESEGQLSNTLQENLTGVRVVRAFGRQAYEMKKFDVRNAEYRDLTYKLIRVLAAYWSMSDGFALLQVGIVLVAGVYLSATGAITLGTLLVFFSYINMLIWPIRQMGRILSGMGRALVSVGRIEEILEVPEETQDPDCVKAPIEGDIVFDNVCFEYEQGKPILQDLSFTVKQGQTAAILGPTGSGKSSLVHLMQRLYDYKSGSITIGGVELKKIDKRWLRRNVGIVLQEPFLFSRTIRENIGIAKRGVTQEEILEASRKANVHAFIKEFENGYDTMVGERGVTLSGGQKQRVAIARSLISNTPVLIFDDSLSAVDTETDAAIRRELKKRSRQTTTFIISHRITTLSEADMILVLEEGRLVQSGTHEELINQAGLYQRIWSIQSSLEQELKDDRQLAMQ